MTRGVSQTALAPAPQARSQPARAVGRKPNYKRRGGNPYRHVTRRASNLICREGKIHRNCVSTAGGSRRWPNPKLSGHDIAVLADDGMQLNRSLHLLLSGFLRISRRHLRHHQPFDNPWRHPHSLGRLRRLALGCGRTRRVLRSASQPNPRCQDKGDEHQSEFSRAPHLTPPGPSPAACSANSAAPQSESRSNIPGTS
jgi:hypothetical protein